MIGDGFKMKKKTVWYDTVKLFRQKKIGNWDETFKKISKDLEIKIKDK